MATIRHLPLRRAFAVVAAAAAMAWAGAAQAHCDTLDGPVVSDARRALDTGNVNLVLGWVRKQDEAELRHAFQQAAAVRKTGAAARELADSYFFETLVRVHRAGEGAPYTGLKPAGAIEPAIAAADKSIASGQLEPVAKLVTQRTQQGLHQQFAAVTARKKYDPNDVAAARAYVDAYVQYVHYVERVHDAAATGHDAHPAPAAPAKPAGHQH
ncbi:DUF6448 family protein [Ramlibacter sp.]|uniref:DUF6448 family protein n=1 Tax=Ramlibacter sp. TaxID=1917967 RepID=UPI002C3754A4|nr:DUF6448 family protein [Ramlibacter sp.]HWI84655.1 DUF6448 family protein [Ramlibacter sp.]